MTLIHRSFYIILFVFICGISPGNGYGRTVGLFLNTPDACPGYTLFSPSQYTDTYLIDNEGRLMHSWHCAYRPGHAAYLSETGTLIRTGYLSGSISTNFWLAAGAGGIVQEIDWDATVLREFEYCSDLYLSHHDIALLPYGTVLMIAWEYKTRAEALAAGRASSLLSTSSLWPDHVIEVDLVTGIIVWEWHAWDHLVQNHDPTKPNYGDPADHPELIDLNHVDGGSADWLHINGIDYNSHFDQIVLSVHNFNELWVIDHSTTTAEAAGHTGGRYGKGGDLLYRWGNPETYGAGTDSDRKFFGQHDTQWIPRGFPGEGNVLVYNNGLGRPAGAYSSVEEIVPPVDTTGSYPYTAGSPYDPPAQEWIYTADPPESFYSYNISGAQRMPNGNTLVCCGALGKFFEVTPAGKIVWLYVNPVIHVGPLTRNDPIPGSLMGRRNSVFKIRRYDAKFPAFEMYPLSPGNPIELPPGITCDTGVLVIMALTVIGYLVLRSGKQGIC